MTATEELRRLLDERGVEWVDTGDGSTLIPAQTAMNVAWDVNRWPSGKDMGDCLWVQNRHPLTPEQAIAATLGEVRAGSSRFELTAEQVRKAIYDCSAFASYDGRTLHASGIRLHSVTDELNAALGGGECEQVLIDCDDGLMPPFTAHCSKCGTEWGFTPKFCPECGAKVTGTRDERKAVER